MGDSEVASLESAEQSAPPNMIRIPGGMFRMGSDQHYPEEAPVHRVSVDGFRIDRTPVTNRQFKEFVNATGHVTFAEIPPDPKNYPGALPHMLYAGSLVFTPPDHAVDLRNWSQWWRFLKGANWRHPYGPKSNINGLDNHPVVHVAFADALAYAKWAGKDLPTEAEWEFAARGGLDGAEFAWGDEFTPDGKHIGQHLAGRFPARESLRRRFRAHLAGDGVSAERLRRLRHDRQCLGMDDRLVVAEARRRRAQGLLHSGKSARRPRGGELRSLPTRIKIPRKVHQRRLASVRAQLLPPLPPGRAPRGTGGYVDQPCRLSLHHPRGETTMTDGRSRVKRPNEDAAKQQRTNSAHLLLAAAAGRIDVRRDGLQTPRRRRTAAGRSSTEESGPTFSSSSATTSASRTSAPTPSA